MARLSAIFQSQSLFFQHMIELITNFEYITIIIEKDEEAWKFFIWRKHLSSSLFTLLPFLVHHLIDRGVLVHVLEAPRVCGMRLGSVVR